MKTLAVILIIPVLAFVGFLVAETTPAPVPPKVPAELQAKLWQAQAKLTAAQLALEHTKEAVALEHTKEADDLKQRQREFQQVVQEWQKVCGADWVTSSDADSTPTCAEKPKPPAPPAVKPEPTPAPPKK